MRPSTLLRGAVVAILASTGLAADGDNSDPCHKLGEAQRTDEAVGDTTFTVDEVHNCLRSVPFSTDDANELIKNFRNTFSWHSTQAFYKKSVEKRLEIPKFDLNNTITDIENKVKGGYYKNGYDFWRDIALVSTHFRDAHAAFRPACGDSLFQYFHDYHLMAVSDKSVGKKDIYTVKTSRRGATKPTLDRKVERINGQSAQEFLVRMIETLPDLYVFVDPDARYNALFENYPAEPDEGSFSHRIFWAENSKDMKLELEFEGGKTEQVEWKARFRHFVAHFNSTDSFAKNVCYHDDDFMKKVAPAYAGPLWYQDPSGALYRKESGSGGIVEARNAGPEPEPQSGDDDNGNSTAEATSTTSPEPSATDIKFPVSTATITGYPAPVIRSPDDTILVFADPDGDKELAILRLPGFNVDLGTAHWSRFLNETLAKMNTDGYKRLIIDISSNGGGKGVLGKRAVRIIFPEVFDGSGEPDNYINMRYHEGLAKIWRADTNPNFSELDEKVLFTNLKGQNFSSLDEVLGPYHNKDYDDYFTAKSLWRADGNPDDDYGSKSDWEKENIVIVSNGMCSSTCHSFIELMMQIGVRAYAYGGRPDSKAMQAAGGTKGGTTSKGEDLILESFKALGDTSGFDFLPKYTRTRIRTARVNLENQFRVGDDDPDNGVPLMFQFTPACKKLPVTKKMAFEAEELWRYVRDTAWKNGKATKCDEKQINSENLRIDGGGLSIGRLVWQKIHPGGW